MRITMPQNSSYLIRSVDFRSTGESGDGRTLEGYAAVFNQDTEINSAFEGQFLERIAPNSFAKTLREHPSPKMQFDHGRDSRVGSVPIGAFTEIREDGKGLFVRARLHDNPVVEPIRQAIESGAISGMSFKFRVVKDEWRDSAGKVLTPDEAQRLSYAPGTRGPLQRTIREVQLAEAGPVVFPAYAGTSVGVRNTETNSLTAELAQRRLALLLDF
ncbi:HK97 family phage prohead protease [Rhodococcus qingshengii]|nr:HK97 family phage prohead protease [Rhodococcus qingshengii]QXC42194.1 HK97 family phage prohead protease [Rhodococcus qingshengii]